MKSQFKRCLKSWVCTVKETFVICESVKPEGMKKLHSRSNSISVPLRGMKLLFLRCMVFLTIIISKG